MSRTGLNEAWQPYEPSASNPWTMKQVAHLYRRGGFGASWQQLQDGVKLGPEKCVDRLLHTQQPRQYSDGDLESIARYAIASGTDERMEGWWILRMLHGPSPLTERMTLFWHDHFATSQDKVANLDLMHAQNKLLRQYALGKFWDPKSGGMLLAMSRDPAMLVWLDSNSNRRMAPNENYARELMELFALGIGHYTETDIKEAARAFTGWFVKRNKFQFIAPEHDRGTKRVLGESGPLTGENVVEIVARRPESGRFIVSKLTRYLVRESTPISDDDIRSLGEAYQRRGWDTGWLVKTILRSKLFYAKESYRNKISSPIDFVLGTVRRLEAENISPLQLANTSAKLGQRLFRPPNVAGWEAGRAWINSATLIGRSNFSASVVSTGEGPFAGRVDLPQLCRRHGAESLQDQQGFLLDLLVDGDVPESARESIGRSLNLKNSAAPGERLRTMVQSILNLPEYQVV